MQTKELPFHSSPAAPQHLPAAEIPVPDLQKYMDGWMLDCSIREVSPRTIEKRRGLLHCFRWWLNQKKIDCITVNTMRQFFLYVQKGHLEECGRWGNPRETQPVKPATVASFHSTLRAMFNWIVAEVEMAGGQLRSPMTHIAPPIDRPDEIQTFTQEQIDRLISAAERGKHPTRDRAILLFLLDTGVRVSELCDCTMQDIDMVGRKATVMGKGRKTRNIFFGRKTARAFYAYLREKQRQPEDSIWLGDGGRHARQPLTRSGVSQLIARMGKEAGIESARCSPHTFRHTFAITFLRNGGNQFTLMYLLGHTDTKMTKRYVAIAQADAENQHRQCSPVDRMKKTDR